MKKVALKSCKDDKAVAPNPAPGDSAFPFWSTLWRYFRPWKYRLILAMSLNMIVGLAITLQTAIPKYLTDDVLLADYSKSDKAFYASLILFFYIFNVLVVRMGIFYLGARIFARSSEEMISWLRSRFFSHINYLCLRFHTRKSSGELFSYLFGSPLQSIIQFLNFVTNTVPYSLFTLLSTVALVASWNLIMTAILAVCLLPTSISVDGRAKRSSRSARNIRNTKARFPAKPPTFCAAPA